MDARVVREEISKNVRDAVMTAVIPVLQDICVSLFQQLNETFRAGLEQYMRQMQAFCAGTMKTDQITNDSAIDSSSSFSDTSALIRLIENHCFAAAFEKVFEFLLKIRTFILMLKCHLLTR